MRPVCLDLTRLISRTGSGPATGIDRVEAAYLKHLLERNGSLFGLIRTASGLACLERKALGELSRQLDQDGDWSEPDLRARLSPRLTPERRRAESWVRGCARTPGILPAETHYLNVGHANLDPRTTRTLRRCKGLVASILIHDTIPLRSPSFQRPGSVGKFRRKLDEAARFADDIISLSEAEAAQLGTLFSERRVRVVPPGPTGAAPTKAPYRPIKPYFVVLGTIEPRKNLDLVLEVWNDLGPRAPDLTVIGRRGWASPETIARLDRLKASHPGVLEFNSLDDGRTAALLAGAEALLFPSLDEGYGFPPIEALRLRTVPVCAPLPVYRETLGDMAVYADPADRYHWTQIVSGKGGLAEAQQKLGRGGVCGLAHWGWQEHLERVLGRYL